jgi:uncharacterized protein YigA (DUF484 family)
MTSQSSGPGELSEGDATLPQAAPFVAASSTAPTEDVGVAEADPSAPEPTESDDAVAAFLMADPDFFERHPSLVASLRIPHASGPAISLIEHQVGILRGQLEDERRRLAHIISRAREYEALSARLHTLTLGLIAAPDQQHVEEILHEAMCRDLNAQCVALKLFRLPAPGEDADPLVEAFHDFLDRRHCLCGPLDQDKSRLLFGDFGTSVRSAALIPIRAGERAGVLAIGSGDEARFGPGMATDILDRMGEIVGQRLQVIDHGHAR